MSQAVKVKRFNKSKNEIALQSTDIYIGTLQFELKILIKV